MIVLRAIARGRAGGAASVLDTAARCYGPVAPDWITPRAATLRRRPMANIQSQKKRILRAERERLENRRYTSTIKTYFRRVEAAVAGGDAEAAQAEHQRLVQMIDKAVKRGALHRNTGARKKSRAARTLRGDAPA
jgi:small subunit ribosomal protein S20